MGTSAMEDEARRSAADLLEPVASIRNPPTYKRDWNGRDQPPPERQKKIRQQTEQDESDPEDLSLHEFILSLRFSFARQTYTKVQWRGQSRK